MGKREINIKIIQYTTSTRYKGSNQNESKLTEIICSTLNDKQITKSIEFGFERIIFCYRSLDKENDTEMGLLSKFIAAS